MKVTIPVDGMLAHKIHQLLLNELRNEEKDVRRAMLTEGLAAVNKQQTRKTKTR